MPDLAQAAPLTGKGEGHVMLGTFCRKGFLSVSPKTIYFKAPRICSKC